MQKINKESLEVLVAILNEMQDKQHIKFANDPSFMPLTVERVGEGIKTPYGEGFLLSLCHYKEMNGDLCTDPEVVFIVVDNRGKVGKDSHWFIAAYPQYYKQEIGRPLEQELIVIEDGKTSAIMPKAQRSTTTFCGTWFRNIKWQQKLKPYKFQDD